MMQMVRTMCSQLIRMLVASAAILLVSACNPGFGSPPAGLEEGDLVGTWETYYDRQTVDTLQFRADGTFRQVYAKLSEEESKFRTSWNRWWLERLADGSIRVHLDGARYFLASPAIQSDGFYDPFSKEFLHPINELVLVVRMDSDGELILHHLWTGSDGGFALIGGKKEFFRRVKGP